MSLHAGPAGTALTIEYDGKTYRARPVTDEVLGEFEAALAGRARKGLDAVKASLTREEYLERLDGVARDFEGGEYSLYSQRGQAFLLTREGALTVAALLFGVGKAEVLRLTAARQDEVTALITQVVRESFPPPPEPAPIHSGGGEPAPTSSPGPGPAKNG
jgi:hypothetical protein